MKKFFRLNVIIAIAILAFQANNAFAQNGKGKTAVYTAVSSFYKFHRSSSNTFNKRNVEARKRWFTGELYGLFVNELKLEREYLKANPTDKPYFGDGFPFQPYDECSANNRSYLNTYKIGNPEIRNRRATVEVKFYEPRQCGGKLVDSYKVELVNSKSGWLIDDWAYSDNRKLSTDLKTKHY